MPRKSDYERILIVEGADDRHSIIGLMQHHTDWPDDSKRWPVFVEMGKSVDEILAPGYLSAEIKQRRVKSVGVMLDADGHAAGRYQRVQQLCERLFPELPISLPATGLITENDDKRFGLWIMPDNRAEGDIETFLRNLVPDEAEPLWQHACASVQGADEIGSRGRETHITKANLYTWLAWQDPPGQSPGLALTQKVLDPHSDKAQAFVAWFMDLFQL